jgi:hypothetical protein
VDRVCVGALVDEDYQAELARAGFEQIEVEPTQVYGLKDLASMAGDLTASGLLPGGLRRQCSPR